MSPWRWRNRIRKYRTRASRFCRLSSSTRRDRATEYSKLFVVGAPRSGTTWINAIFACHPAVITERESSLYSRIMKPIRKYGAHNPLAWETISGSFQRQDVGLHRYVDRQTLGRILEEARCSLAAREEWMDEQVASYVIRRIIDDFFFKHGGSSQHLFVEKTPIHVLFGREILRAFPEARILHVLRDGRDVCASYETRARGADWTRASRAEQIQLWKQCVEAGIALQEDPDFRERVDVVRYEDMKHDPISGIARVFAFADLPATTRQVARIARQTEFRRHRKKGPGLHNNKGQVGGWRDQFSEADVRLVEQIAGELLQRCGYVDSGGTRAA